MNKDIIKKIKEIKFLSRVFAFKSDNKDDFFICFKIKMI